MPSSNLSAQLFTHARLISIVTIRGETRPRRKERRTIAFREMGRSNFHRIPLRVSYSTISAAYPKREQSESSPRTLRISSLCACRRKEEPSIPKLSRNRSENFTTAWTSRYGNICAGREHAPVLEYVELRAGGGGGYSTLINFNRRIAVCWSFRG